MRELNDDLDTIDGWPPHLQTFLIQCHLKGFSHCFCQASGESCQQTKHKISHSAHTCANWPHATLYKPNQYMVRPLPHEKQADRTSSSGLRKIPINLNICDVQWYALCRMSVVEVQVNQPSPTLRLRVPRRSKEFTLPILQ